MGLPKVLPRILFGLPADRGRGTGDSPVLEVLRWVTTYNRGPTGDSGQMETPPYLVSGLERQPCRRWQGLQGCKACEAWSASVQEIYGGNAKQRELRGVAYNGNDGGRAWAYYKTVYMA